MKSTKDTYIQNTSERKKQRVRRRKRIWYRVPLVVVMTFSAVLALTDAVSTTQPWHGFTEAEILPAESEQRRDSRQMADLRPVEPLETSPTVAKSEVSADDWQLLLVNPWNQLPEGYTVELTELRNGHAVDTRAYPDLQRMMDDCRAAGLEPVICSSYRTLETQQRLYENKIRRLMNEGLSREEATAQAGTVVAVPGTSEHQTGLAIDLGRAAREIDFIRPDFPEEGACGRFRRLAPRYGFIQRYHREKESLTGIACEPWHYRYVGTPHALLMEREGLCLEEYLDWVQTAPRTCRLEHGRSARVFYMPCAGDETELRLPEGCCQVSGDNRNGFVVTVWEV